MGETVTTWCCVCPGERGLKSEISSPNLVVRFGLLLEAYCRGQGAYLKHLNRQVAALDKLITLTDSIKVQTLTNERRLRYLCDQISQDDYMESLQNFYSPMENTLMLGELLVSAGVSLYNNLISPATGGYIKTLQLFYAQLDQQYICS